MLFEIEKKKKTEAREFCASVSPAILCLNDAFNVYLLKLSRAEA
jgi:hypothetical protein